MVFAGISIFPNGSLSNLNLTPNCENSLYQKVNCDGSISILGSSSYVGSFDNSTLTALICDAGCGSSISDLHNAVSANCGNTVGLIPGLPFLGLVDMFWSNWNQSCFVDPTTNKNCNDVIAAFPNVTDLSDLPTSDLCSYCNVEKLALMQADAYTDVYDDHWEATYKYVAQTCKITVADFNATASVFNVSVPSVTPSCVSNVTYATKRGDTCDSIAISHGVSAATMFYTNPTIANCSSILPGTDLCLPLQCSDIYTVQPNDTCTSIAIANGISTQDLLSFNSQLNWNCTNLQSVNPYWGSTLCVSTPGGTYTGQALNISTTTGSQIVSPPAGATVAPGTTTNCGQWFVNNASLNLTCAQLCLSNEIAINLFTAANPSLNKTTCDSDLITGDAYCVDPLPGWNWGTNSTSNATTTTTIITPTSSATTSYTSIASNTATTTRQTTTTVSVPGPTQSGIPANCNAYYVAQPGDTCATPEAKYGITSAQFHAWNPSISSDCSQGFWANEAYCVGVSSSGTTATSGPSSTEVVPPGPTQSGIPANCNEYYIAQCKLDGSSFAIINLSLPLKLIRSARSN
ncbi:hypothetical protein BGW36DRAFT_297138 [Talaromyces proteolyticus]|uniref:LysM domain-containing protein n=1 Tax=Talaromyces proteolyticus TaxID=1131652 RepID=A0AAD4KPT2_9EURO|nr:uncharacterized protein BGW36DRAFT_297138 [Talaromyces proteolyticus]KAH8696451.1 hypothetical protein BGW36DRAFT_297138 [Talaromyces proteolyticus]